MTSVTQQKVFRELSRKNSCTGGAVLSRSVEGTAVSPTRRSNDTVRREVNLLKHPDEPRRENAVLRRRLSWLSAAAVRVTASLDLNTILHEAVDSARALTRRPL